MEAVAKATELTLCFLDFLAQDNNWQSLDSLSLGIPTERPCQNTASTEEQPSLAVKKEGMNFLFMGEAIALASSPLIPPLAKRLAILKPANWPPDALHLVFNTADCLSMPFGGTGLGEAPAVSIDSRVPLSPLPADFETALATVAVHEFSHRLRLGDLNPYSKDPLKWLWLDLYNFGKSMGTWDLLDDSVLLNFYPEAGHPKDQSDEGFASGVTAYTIFSATYRRIIALLALDPSAMKKSLQNEPFGSEALNRVFEIIYYQTPNRDALRENLIDIYEFVRDNHAKGIEFAEDF